MEQLAAEGLDRNSMDTRFTSTRQAGRPNRSGGRTWGGSLGEKKPEVRSPPSGAEQGPRRCSGSFAPAGQGGACREMPFNPNTEREDDGLKANCPRSAGGFSAAASPSNCVAGDLVEDPGQGGFSQNCASRPTGSGNLDLGMGQRRGRCEPRPRTHSRRGIRRRSPGVASRARVRGCRSRSVSGFSSSDDAGWGSGAMKALLGDPRTSPRAR